MKLLAPIFCFLSITAFAQYDTAYVIKYPEKLALYVYQSKPLYTIDITQSKYADTSAKSAISYHTVADNVTGFGFDYDKIGLSIGFKTPQPADKRKGNSDYSQLGISVGGIKFRIEASLNFYEGFYDDLSGHYIPSFNDSTFFFRNPTLKNNSFKIKAFYFLNNKKRFSYNAAYGNSARQVKSAGSFILVGNVYSYGLHSGHYIIPALIDSFYNPWQHLNEIQIRGLSAGVGYSHTFVIFKKVFLNLLGSIGLDEQHRILHTSDRTIGYDAWVTAISAYDFRSSLGFNASNFFFSFQTIIDGNTYKFSSFNIRSQSYGVSTKIGFRFPVKPPGFYKKIQQTKVYKMI